MQRTPTVPVPVRLDSLTKTRLKNAAKKLGSNTSAVIRFAVVNQLAQIESGRIVLSENTEQKEEG